jgi:hypothetical protein
MIRKDKDRTLTGKALEQYYRKHKNINLLAETLMKINKIDPRLKSKPLSDEEIYQLWCEADNTELLPEMRMKDGSINYIITTFARSIEERHGIK